MDASKYYSDSKDGKAPEHHKHEQEQGEEHHKAHDAPEPSRRGRKDSLVSLINSRHFAIAIGIIILIIAVWVRLGLAQYQGLFEPDAFFYYSVVKAALLSHLHEPQYLSISGFPSHNFIGEAPGLPYIAVISYLMVGWTGLSVLTVMRWLPMIIGLAEIVLAYFMAKEFTNSRFFGLLAMFMVAVSSGNIARTAALVYRGDTFVSLPLMLALYLIMKGMKETDFRKEIVYGVIAVFLLSAGILIWNGAQYIVAVAMLGILLIILYSFIMADMDMARKALVLTGLLFLVFPLQIGYVALKGARSGLELVGGSMLILYVPMLLAALLAYYILRKKMGGFLLSRLNRSICAAVFVIIVGAVILFAFKGYIGTLATVSGTAPLATNTTALNESQARGYAIGTTTQELQKPSLQFIFASFGLQMILAPIGIVLLLILGDTFATGSHEHRKRLLSITPQFLLMLAYLAITADLQNNAIRWNALLSIPVAMFAAYGLYGIVMSAINKHKVGNMAFAAMGLAMALLSLYLLVQLEPLLFALVKVPSYQYVVEGASTIAVLVCLLAYPVLWVFHKNPVSAPLRYAALTALVLFFVASASSAAIESYGSMQADGINSQFLSAMSWMKNNTPINATVLALWPDGSVVEGWANRTSYMDSVGGENSTRIFHFARFLLNSSADAQYLYSIGKPQYLVARQYWMVELQGLVLEGIPPNASAYNYAIMQPLTISNNSTAQFYTFGSGMERTTLIVQHNNSSSPYSAYVYQSGSSYASQVSRLIFYNSSNNIYNILNATGGQVVNYTFMIIYSGSRISDGILMTNALEESNLFKFIFLCNQQQCSYNSPSVNLQAVYINNDTRIYKINYK